MKKSLRESIRRKLAAMAPAVAHAKSMAASKRLMALPEFEAAQTIMTYLPMPGEVDPSPVALRAWQAQKTVAAPKTYWSDRRMIAVEIRSLETGLAPGRYSLREPAGGEPVLLEELDLVIVPALAFDRHGNRLGKGAGFYDRFLASRRLRAVTVGLAFTEQVVESVPVADNDMSIQVLVTDEEVLRFPPPAPRGGQTGRSK